MKSKVDRLTKQIESFEKSERGVKDYIQLFNTVQRVTSQGSGLCWSSVEKCIKNAILNVDLEETLT